MRRTCTESPPIPRGSPCTECPELFGVGLEENLVESLVEAVHHPLLECLFDGMRPVVPPQIAEDNPDRVDRAESEQGVADFERVVEEALVVDDTRQPRSVMSSGPS